MKPKTRCYIYTRVSTAMQVDGFSLEAQKEKLRSFAAFQEMEIAGEYCDEGFSGKNIQGRLAFRQMLQDIEARKDGISYVLVFKLSRFGRNAADVLNSLQLMQDYGVNLICVEDGIDSSKDAGKLIISVLSAVAEIERENIRTQTMAGREQKAREGKWNGGFAPYGYMLVDGQLLINEEEAEVIRIIYDKYIHSNGGAGAVAEYLNTHGYKKITRQNGMMPTFSAPFVVDVLDNPIYMGKIAYGRRRAEKKVGTRNEMHVVVQSDFPIYEGQHKAIVSEETWQLAHEKRQKSAFVREKIHDINHAHVLSGILRCPDCGKGMYGNVSTPHKKDNKIRHYYYCKNTVKKTGHECRFRTNLDQEEINRQVAAVISAMVSQPDFVEAIKARIGTSVDTADLEKKLESLEAQRRQAEGVKARLERQMDSIPVDDAHYEQKIADLQRRYDDQYDILAEITAQQDEVNAQLQLIRQEQITGEQIYQLLLAFNQLYPTFTEADQKRFMQAFVERVDIYPQKTKDGLWIRSITFHFPVPVEGEMVRQLPLESQTMHETVISLSQQRPDHYVRVGIDLDDMDVTPAESKASYQEIKEYVLAHTGLKVSCLYIAQVKAKHGIIERACYNKAKTEGNRVPKCPPEKEKAIEEALRRFQMIP